MDDGVVIVGELVSGVFPVYRWGEGSDVNSLSYASGVVVWLARKNAEILLAEVVVVVCCMLHDCGSEVAAALAGCRKVFLSPFFDGPLRFTDILARARDAVGSRTADMVNNASCCGFLELILRVDKFFPD